MHKLCGQDLRQIVSEGANSLQRNVGMVSKSERACLSSETFRNVSEQTAQGLRSFASARCESQHERSLGVTAKSRSQQPDGGNYGERVRFAFGTLWVILNL